MAGTSPARPGSSSRSPRRRPRASLRAQPAIRALRRAISDFNIDAHRDQLLDIDVRLESLALAENTRSSNTTFFRSRPARTAAAEAPSDPSSTRAPASSAADALADAMLL